MMPLPLNHLQSGAQRREFRRTILVKTHFLESTDGQKLGVATLSAKTKPGLSMGYKLTYFSEWKNKSFFSECF